MIIDLPAPALHDEDIFLAYTLADFNLCFANAEFGEVDFGGWNAEVCADCLGELRMGGTGEDDDIAHHFVRL